MKFKLNKNLRQRKIYKLENIAKKMKSRNNQQFQTKYLNLSKGKINLKNFNKNSN